MFAINRNATTDVAAIAARAMHYGDVIETVRYPSIVEKALATVGDEHVSLFVGADELAARGFNIESMALAIAARNITGTSVGEMVLAVEIGEMTIDAANRELFRRRPLNYRRTGEFDEATLKGMGLNVDAINLCLGKTLDADRLTDLVNNVARGWTSVSMANCGLEYKADEACPVKPHRQS